MKKLILTLISVSIVMCLFSCSNTKYIQLNEFINNEVSQHYVEGICIVGKNNKAVVEQLGETLELTSFKSGQPFLDLTITQKDIDAISQPLIVFPGYVDDGTLLLLGINNETMVTDLHNNPNRIKNLDNKFGYEDILKIKGNAIKTETVLKYAGKVGNKEVNYLEEGRKIPIIYIYLENVEIYDNLIKANN